MRKSLITTLAIAIAAWWWLQPSAPPPTKTAAKPTPVPAAPTPKPDPTPPPAPTGGPEDWAPPDAGLIAPVEVDFDVHRRPEPGLADRIAKELDGECGEVRATRVGETATGEQLVTFIAECILPPDPDELCKEPTELDPDSLEHVTAGDGCDFLYDVHDHVYRFLIGEDLVLLANASLGPFTSRAPPPADGHAGTLWQLDEEREIAGLAAVAAPDEMFTDRGRLELVEKYTAKVPGYLDSMTATTSVNPDVPTEGHIVFADGVTSSYVARLEAFQSFMKGEDDETEGVPCRAQPDQVPELVPFGRTATGTTAYLYADRQHPFLRRFFELREANELGADTGTSAEARYSVFLAGHPVRWFRDEFGRWQRCVNVSLSPGAAVEPLIYVYPPVPMSVQVSLQPPSGARPQRSPAVFRSIPDHGRRGWRVDAQPDGTLHVDGARYRSLFWEGASMPKSLPDEGWLIERSDARARLDAIGQILGLSAEEAHELSDYWAPKLRAPYTHAILVPRAQIDDVAPLCIDPPPDQLVRVHFVFRPLMAPRQITAPALAPISARRGLVVVEWGGFVHGFHPAPFTSK